VTILLSLSVIVYLTKFLIREQRFCVREELVLL